MWEALPFHVWVDLLGLSAFQTDHAKCTVYLHARLCLRTTVFLTLDCAVKQIRREFQFLQLEGRNKSFCADTAGKGANQQLLEVRADAYISHPIHIAMCCGVVFCLWWFNSKTTRERMRLLWPIECDQLSLGKTACPLIMRLHSSLRTDQCWDLTRIHTTPHPSTPAGRAFVNIIWIVDRCCSVMWWSQSWLCLQHHLPTLSQAFPFAHLCSLVYLVSDKSVQENWCRCTNWYFVCWLYAAPRGPPGTFACQYAC